MNPLIQSEMDRIFAHAAAEQLFKQNSASMSVDLSKAQKLADRIRADSQARDLSLYREAAEKKVSPWELLEAWDPSPRNIMGDIVSPLDAMERVLYCLGQSLAGGVTVDQFISGPAAILAPAMILRWVQEGIDLGFGSVGVFAATRPITGMTVTPLYLEGDEQQGVAKAPATTSGGKRLGATAKSGLPRTIVSYRDKVVTLGVYGRVLDFGYEVVKYASLDELRLIFLYIGMQIAYDDVGNIFELIDVGDGTTGTPPARLQISGSGGAGTLTWDDIVNAMVQMSNGAPFRITHWIGEAPSLRDFLNLAQFTGANWRETALQQLFGGARGPITTPVGILLVAPNPPADVDHLAFMDSMFAVAKGQESPITIETDKIISMRWEETAIWGTWAFWKVSTDASGIVDYSA